MARNSKIVKSNASRFQQHGEHKRLQINKNSKRAPINTRLEDSRRRLMKLANQQLLSYKKTLNRYLGSSVTVNTSKRLREKIDMYAKEKRSHYLKNDLTVDTDFGEKCKINEELEKESKVQTPTINTTQSALEGGATAILSNDTACNTISDDDCVYIEPFIEKITIEDDAPNKSIPLLKEGMTSTPISKNKSKTQSGDIESDFKDFKDKSIVQKSMKNIRKSKQNISKNIPKNNEGMNDIIVIDDSYEGAQTSSSNKDDSVVFVGETKCPGFLPLSPKRRPHTSGNRLVENNVIRKRAKPVYVSDLFTPSERRQLTEYNRNAYNPNAGVKSFGRKRMIIIDGNNVAYSHSLNKFFSVLGVKIALEFFETQGHEVKVVVPLFRLSKYKSTEPEELERLHREGKIVFTPCKNLPGKLTTSYDDRFILQLACELDAAIISNDNYRDLIQENTAFKKIIENRVVGYTWCNDVFIIPKDPYGKWGPPLNVILNRN